MEYNGVPVGDCGEKWGKLSKTVDNFYILIFAF